MKLYTNYLLYRSAEFNFYLGMVEYGNESLESFEKAIKKYITFTKEIQMFSPDPEICAIDMQAFDSLDDIDLHLPDDMKSNKDKAYLCNTLGQAYNRMIRQELKGCISQVDNERKKTILDYYKKAFVYFKAAVLCDNELSSNKEHYFRNLGSFYELLRFLINDYNQYDRKSIRKNQKTLISIIDKANTFYSSPYLWMVENQKHILQTLLQY